MANILMINLPYSGHTNPTLPLTKELVRRGHRVSYINAEDFREKIEETGATFIPYKNYPNHPTEQQKKIKCFRAAYDTALSLTQKFDLLIYEFLFYPAIRIADIFKIPCIRQFSQPAWNTQSMGEASVLFKLSCKLIDVQVMGKRNARYMGLKHTSLPESVLFDKPNLNIVYTPKSFQTHSDSFGEDYMFVLPPFSMQLSKQEIPYETMKSPIIYISLGSIISNKGFCKECIRAFQNSEFTVILNTGKINPNSLGKIPQNIHAYSFVPQLEVLSKVDIFLTHCGMNSVNEAMSLGVPMIVMPFINDQISNAKRVVELGIGKRIRSFPSSAREMYKTAKSIVCDEKIKNNCLELQKHLKRDNDFSKTIYAIENLVNY
ncbi:nucleotide disphospho-sugar-binding domain-containing protein [Oscillospiraceae bacterium PP1C4]